MKDTCFNFVCIWIRIIELRISGVLTVVFPLKKQKTDVSWIFAVCTAWMEVSVLTSFLCIIGAFVLLIVVFGVWQTIKETASAVHFSY